MACGSMSATLYTHATVARWDDADQSGSHVEERRGEEGRGEEGVRPRVPKLWADFPTVFVPLPTRSPLDFAAEPLCCRPPCLFSYCATMERVVAAIVQTASVAMADRATRDAQAAPLTLKGAVNRVRLANRTSGRWREIMHEGIGLMALARDETSAILTMLLQTPMDVRRGG